VKLHAVIETETPDMIQPIRKDGINAGPFRLNRITWHQHFNEALHEHAEARVVVLVAGDFTSASELDRANAFPGLVSTGRRASRTSAAIPVMAAFT